MGFATGMPTLFLCALTMSHMAFAADVNELRSLDVQATPLGAKVTVGGSSAPTFTVFRLSDPDRLVVDLTGAQVGAIKGHREGVGPVTGIVASQFSDERASVGRILIGLNAASKYDVRADGDRLVISVEGAGLAAATSTAVVPGANDNEAAVIAAAAPAKAAAPGDVVASHVDEVKAAHPATMLKQISVKQNAVTLSADGTVAKFEIIELTDPPRLALDLYGMAAAKKLPKASGQGLVRGVRAAGHADRLRVVIDVDGAMPAYEAKRVRDGLKIALRSKSPSEVSPVAVSTEKDAAAPSEVEIDGKPVVIESAPMVVRSVPAVDIVDVKDVAFEETPTGGRLSVKLSGQTPWKVERPDGRSAVLTLEAARLPRKLERSLDTSDLGTPVKMVSTFPVPGQSDRVRVVVAADGPIEQTVEKTAAGLSWNFVLKGARVEEAQLKANTAGFSAAADIAAKATASQLNQEPRYVGKKVSFEFKDIDVHNLLRIIAEISKKNIIVSDEVNGKVTIRLRNVPWDQAFELIMRSKSLGKEDLGSNIIRVASLRVLEDEARLRLEREKSARVLEPLEVNLVPVNYASASEMSARVKDIMTERGNVAVDSRTNTMIVRDVRSNMARIKSLVQSLDTQTPQVLIESRIVEANTTFQRSVGIQWGGSAQMAPNTGNATGLVFPNSVVVRGAAGQQGSDGTSASPNFAINLPVSVGLGNGGGLGFQFGSAGGALALNLRLTALENQGVVKTISSPRVTTLDNVGAKISQGVSIPFSQVSAGGVNTAFIEASLSLDVTPHITADGSILMTIKASNNQPDPSATGANGQPAIQRKEAQTQVLVRDSDTTVIGGIYVRTGSTSQSTVPILGKIPILGFFFRTTRDVETRNELLIFITPRILNRQAVTQTL